MANTVPEPSRDSPMRDQLLLAVSAYSNLSAHLFTTLASTSTSASPALVPVSSILASLEQLDAHFEQLLALQRQHGKKQRRIEALVAKVKEQETEWRTAVEKLRDAQVTLERICRQGAKDKEQMEASKKGETSFRLSIRNLTHQRATASLTPSQIISYARLISPYSSALPLSDSQQIEGKLPDPMSDPSLRALMPFPSEETVHRGRMGLAIALTEGDEANRAQGMGPEVGETRAAGGQASRPVPTVRPALEPEDEFLDLDLNPDL